MSACTLLRRTDRAPKCEEEIDDVVGLVGKHFTNKKVGDVPVAAGKSAHECVRGCFRDRERGELNAGRPSFRALAEDPGVVGRHFDTDRDARPRCTCSGVSRSRRYAVPRAAHWRASDVSGAAGRARAQHKSQRRRQVIEQPAEELEGAGTGKLQVVDDEYARTGQRRHVVDKHGEEIGADLLARSMRSSRPLRAWCRTLQGKNERRREVRRAGIGEIAREPRRQCPRAPTGTTR